MTKLLIIPSLSFITIFACGIADMFLEYPQRYIQREVQANEIVGTWKLTQDSESRINSYTPEYSGWRIKPYKTIYIYSDGTCEYEVNNEWVTDDLQPFLTEDWETLYSGKRIECTWRLENLSGRTESGASKNVPGIFLMSEVYKKETDSYNVNYIELYIAEEDNEIILWDFIEHSYDALYQDYKKEK
jgi:hypothetical protein